ncbi:MAG TPA: ribonuclease HII [Egibacteraceae bacterium]|nr:ribonuclease HII [Actinomycetota bacterium]HWB72792.1 ribonuclease HII [Egibacteraceae bacterium]
MALPAARRKNVVYSGGRRRRLPDVPGLAHERRWWDEGAVVAGVDEVGRGAWAGPVTYAAVVLPADRRMYKLRDSKLLDAARRNELAQRLAGFALGVSVGHASNGEIDRLGMSAAMRLAARRAVRGLPLRPDVCLLDGNWDFLADYGTHNERIVHGDAHSASVAAASIVAKVARDALMTRLSPTWPAYRFGLNKGYPSPQHQASLDDHGPCPLHRHSWQPIRALVQRRLPPAGAG